MDIFRNLTKGKIKFITFPLAVIAGLIFLPISMGLGFAYLTNKKVSNKKLRFSLLSIIALITLFLGSAWVAALVLPSPEKTPPQSKQTQELGKKEEKEEVKGKTITDKDNKVEFKVTNTGCISNNFALAKKFKIVESKDNWYKPGATIDERLRVKQKVLERTYRIVVPEDIDLNSLKATVGKLLANQQKNDPDIDETTIGVYDRERDAFEAYTVGQFIWGFGGKLGKVTPEIAESNNREGYSVSCDIKERIKQGVKAKSQKPTAREFEIYDDWNGRVNALLDRGISDFDEDKIAEDVAKKYRVTLKEFDKIFLKVTVWNTGGDF